MRTSKRKTERKIKGKKARPARKGKSLKSRRKKNQSARQKLIRADNVVFSKGG